VTFIIIIIMQSYTRYTQK